MIEYLSLERINAMHGDEIQEAVRRVVKSGWYLRGESVRQFEHDFSQYVGCRHCIGVANGLDALTLILRAYMEMGVMSEGDEVIVPANTYIASILAITENRLRPVLVEPRIDTFQIDDEKIEQAITKRTRAIMIVHLYGNQAYTEKIGNICQRHGLALIEDCAQAHGLKRITRHLSIPSASAYSFYPGKNLGALGDAGAVTTDDDALADIVRALGNYGSSEKYVFRYKGRNSRMDEIQAAVLSVKLKYLEEENKRRREIAHYYQKHINNDAVIVPSRDYCGRSVHHIFPILCHERDMLQQWLKEQGVMTMIHYPIPPHLQQCYSEWNDLSLPITEKIHREELSLPCNQAMTEAEVEKVVTADNSFNVTTLSQCHYQVITLLCINIKKHKETMLRLFNNNESANVEVHGTRWFVTYLVVAALFLTVTSLQGISYYDIGFYLSGYQYFNDDPFASYFLAQWYLTFRFLGFVCNVLGIDTYLGLRILRTIFLLVFQTIIYLYLRKSIKTKYIIAGMAMTTLAQYGAYSEINYNDLSIFMLVCAILLYHKGLTSNTPLDPKGHLAYKEHPTLIILSGLFIGISFFMRMVNLTFIFLPFAAIIACKVYNVRVSWWRQLVYFFLGVVVGCLLVLGIAWADGTLSVLQQTFTDLISISTDKTDKHSFGMIARFYLYDVLAEVKMALFVAFVMYGFILARMQASGRLLHVAYAILAAIIAYVVYRDGKAGNIAVGFCLAVFLLDFFTQKLIRKHPKRNTSFYSEWRLNSETKKERPTSDAQRGLLFALAMFIPLVFPIGSNGTNQFYGQMICIVALPIAVAVLMKGSDNPSFHTGKLAGIYIIAAICIGMTVTNVLRPMMEDGNRLQCRYTIDSHATGFLLTNEDNAALHNRMVHEVKPLIPQGSHLICNFSITMISVLDCKPYAIFADAYSTPERAERYLHAAYERSRDGKQLPFLLVDEKKESECFSHIRTVLSTFSPYEEIWRSENYVLLKPKK